MRPVVGREEGGSCRRSVRACASIGQVSTTLPPLFVFGLWELPAIFQGAGVYVVGSRYLCFRLPFSFIGSFIALS